ncbi:alpha/beta fold hydrolase [Halovivax sp.]|uniref:alpha/beta fold hydrolase n=1 Tax=Halovivax sp. TaxID=1935978 RepID=UPI0025BC459D|nr:alpha/beta hydrolase [Halovivax sp.]
MPTASNGDVSLYYEVDGRGEPVVFVSEAGLGGWSWGWQHAALPGPFRTVVWDLRGTGRSDAPPGPYDVATLVADLTSILSAIDARRAHVVGAGLGGAVALRAARDSTRVESLALLGTGARGADFDLDALYAPPHDREALRETLEATLSADFRDAQPDVLGGIVDWRADGDAAEAGFRAQTAALDGFDATDWGYEVTVPALVVHGADDGIVPRESGRALADALPRGAFLSIPDAGHLAHVERSRAVNDHLLGFLEAQAHDAD